MLNCREFEQWLNDQDSSTAQKTKLVHDHIRHCESCDRLYHADMAMDTMIKEGLKSVDPPPGLIAKARRKIESESSDRRLKLLKVPWKAIIPALTMAGLVLVLVMNPFSGQLRTIDDVVSYSIAHHLDSKTVMTFRAGEISDAGLWFSERLKFPVKVPALERLGLTLLGGRKCTLGRVSAAYLYCHAKGKPASLFIINPNDLNFHIGDTQKYTIEDRGIKVMIWKEAGVVSTLVT